MVMPSYPKPITAASAPARSSGLAAKGNSMNVGVSPSRCPPRGDHGGRCRGRTLSGMCKGAADALHPCSHHSRTRSDTSGYIDALRRSIVSLIKASLEQARVPVADAQVPIGTESLAGHNQYAVFLEQLHYQLGGTEGQV